MSWRDAPLYVEAHDLALWVIDRAGSWTSRGEGLLAPPAVNTAHQLVTSVALALTFPTSRKEHLEAADQAIVRLRVTLCLAREMGLLSAGGLRFAAGRLAAIGRMVGGWRKRLKPMDSPEGSELPPEPLQGSGPPAARTS